MVDFKTTLHEFYFSFKYGQILKLYNIASIQTIVAVYTRCTIKYIILALFL